MTRLLIVWLAIAVTIGADHSAGLSAQRGLRADARLPTAAEAAEIQDLRQKMVANVGSSLHGPTLARIKSVIENFAIRQFDAAPSMGVDLLQTQLRQIYPGYPGDDEPYLFATDKLAYDGNTRRVSTVTYVVGNGAHGPGTSEVIVDCYMSGPGPARLVGRRENDFSGYFPHGHQPLESVVSNSTFVVHGRMTGSNGLGGWKAAVYECSPSGLRLAWQTPALIGLRLTASDDFITLRYVAPGDLLPASGATAFTYELWVLRGAEAGPVQVRLVSKQRILL